MSLRKFIHNNLVAIIIVPTIIGIHFGVDRLQYNENLVAEHERKDLPIVILYKDLKKKFLDITGLTTENSKES